MVIKVDQVRQASVEDLSAATVGALRIALDYISRMDANCEPALFKFLLLSGLFLHNDHLRSGDKKEIINLSTIGSLE